MPRRGRASLMSGFNWDPFGPDAGRDEMPYEAEPSRDESPTFSDWDFALAGDDSGISASAMNAQLEEFMAATLKAQEEATEVTASSWDQDRLVRVTVNSMGVVVDTEFASDAVRRSSSRSLAVAVTEAAQTAAARAHASVQEKFVSVAPGIDQLNELAPDDPGTPPINSMIDQARRFQQRMYPDPTESDDPTSVGRKKGPDRDR